MVLKRCPLDYSIRECSGRGSSRVSAHLVGIPTAREFPGMVVLSADDGTRLVIMNVEDKLVS